MTVDQPLKALDAAITRGIADAETGRTQDIDSVREELQKRFEA